jgi:hypothetical protein
MINLKSVVNRRVATSRPADKLGRDGCPQDIEQVNSMIRGTMIKDIIND